MPTTLTRQPEPLTGPALAKQAAEQHKALTAEHAALTEQRATAKGTAKGTLSRKLAKLERAMAPLAEQARMYATPTGRKRPTPTGVSTSGTRECASGKACCNPLAGSVPTGANGGPLLPVTKFGTLGHSGSGPVERESNCRSCRTARRAHKYSNVPAEQRPAYLGGQGVPSAAQLAEHAEQQRKAEQSAKRKAAAAARKAAKAAKVAESSTPEPEPTPEPSPEHAEPTTEQHA